MDFENLPDDVNNSLNLAFFLAVAVMLAFGSLQTAGTALNTERPAVSVISCSMYPELNVGDIIIVKGTEFSGIQENDTVVFNVEKQARLTIDGEDVRLDENSDTVNTSIGKVKLVDAASSNENGAAIITVDGEQIRLNAGQSEIVDGVDVRLDYAAGMETPIIHRVVEKHEDYLETKGDNNKEQIPFEKEIRPENIYGVQQFKIPRIGGFKLLAMDFFGLNGGKPIVFDTYPVCQDETE